MAPQTTFRNHLASGRLVELIPGSTLDVALFWQTNSLSDVHIATLTRAFSEKAEKALICLIGILHAHGERPLRPPGRHPRERTARL